jgi:hypothetical protein
MMVHGSSLLIDCAAAIQKGKGGLDSIIDLIFMESIVLENLSLEQ